MSCTAESLSQVTADTASDGKLWRVNGGFTSAAEILFPRFHGSFTRRYLHGAQIYAGPAPLAEVRAHAEGEIHSAMIAPADKTDGPGLVRFFTHTHTPSAKNAVVVAKGVSGLGDATPHGDILDGLGIGCLGYEQFRDVAPQFLHAVGVGIDHHAFLGHQGARSSDLGTTVLYMFNDTEPTGAYFGHGREMAQVRNADAVKEGGVQDARTFRCTYGRPVKG
jgi:hypothetical protein